MNESVISWTGPSGWHASGHWISYGPRLERCCITKTGAKLGAWRRRRRGRTP